MTTIRRMEADDLDAVRHVDAAAFEAWLRRARGWKEDLPPRTRTNVLVMREKDPAGCFVAEQDGRVVGFIFSRTWGSVGWFGTFGVLPQHQRRGIGKRLIGASLGYLRQDPERQIGLETMPDSPFNLDLYLRRGFQVRFLSLRLSKALDPPARYDVELPRWSELDVASRRRWMADLREATEAIRPGLDYAKEMRFTARYDLGDTLLLAEDGRAVGASTVRLAPMREGRRERRAVAQPIILHPAYATAEAFRTLLRASEALARTHEAKSVILPVNARHIWALERVIQDGYRVGGAAARMVLAGTDKGPSLDRFVNLARWAG